MDRWIGTHDRGLPDALRNSLRGTVKGMSSQARRRFLESMTSFHAGLPPDTVLVLGTCTSSPLPPETMKCLFGDIMLYLKDLGVAGHWYPERHKSGNWHAHYIVALPDGMSVAWLRRAIWKRWKRLVEWQGGRADLRGQYCAEAKSFTAATVYLSKEATKAHQKQKGYGGKSGGTYWHRLNRDVLEDYSREFEEKEGVSLTDIRRAWVRMSKDAGDFIAVLRGNCRHYIVHAGGGPATVRDDVRFSFWQLESASGYSVWWLPWLAKLEGIDDMVFVLDWEMERLWVCRLISVTRLNMTVRGSSIVEGSMECTVQESWGWLEMPASELDFVQRSLNLL